MDESPPRHWGSIDAETAESAAAVLERGERRENRGYPFSNITIAGQMGSASDLDPDLRRLKDAKDQVEGVCLAKIL